MKILVISEVFYPENFLINDLVKEWKKQGKQVDIISQYPSYPESYVYPGYSNKGERIENWEGSKIHRFPFIEGYKTNVYKKIRNYLRYVRGASKIGRRIGKDYDMIFVSQTGPLTVALPAIRIKKKFGTPATIWTFDIWPDVVYMYGIPRNIFTKFILNRFIAYVYRQFDNILISSSGFKSSIQKFVPDKNIYYTPNWLQPVDFAISELHLDKEKFNFTFTGNISLYQNITNVVLGFHKAGMQDCVLNIIGNGSAYEQVKACIRDNKIKNVRLHKRIPYNQIDDLLQHSDAFVLPLLDNREIEKTEPLKLQSYLSVGKPIFGILSGTCRQIIEENELGLCASPSDIEDIARGFKAMKEYTSTNKEKVFENSRRLKNTRFNKERIIETINGVICGKTSI
ncbi:MAG: glycosyltransferase family 4 protein [Bacteroidales bacterium]|nr:glycosyltransferase family 4 protein [Bacteroidales bacterium]